MSDLPAPTTDTVVVARSDAVTERAFTDPSNAVQTQAGQLFVIALPSNPSTGFAWMIGPIAGGAVTFVGSTYLAQTNAMIGAGGQQVLIFRAVKAGSADLQLHYARPSDHPDSGASKTFHVLVSARP